MSEKAEGTFFLDGLLEGRVPPMPGSEEKLRDWVRFAASEGLHFSLEIEGGSFNILGDNTPVAVDAIGPEPAERVSEALGQLLKVFPPDDRKRLFSTLRSIEYRRGEEAQTLYAIGPGGTIEVRGRTVEAETTSGPHALSRREKVRLALLGIAVALLVFAVSSVFVDYRSILADVVSEVVPVDVRKIEMELGAFREYFAVQKKERGRGGKTIVVTLKRTDRFPLSDADMEAALDQAGDSLVSRLTVEALAKGYVRCENFDEKGDFLGFTVQRIAELGQKETTEIALPISRRRRPRRIVFTY